MEGGGGGGGGRGAVLGVGVGVKMAVREKKAVRDGIWRRGENIQCDYRLKPISSLLRFTADHRQHSCCNRYYHSVSLVHGGILTLPSL